MAGGRLAKAQGWPARCAICGQLSLHSLGVRIGVQVVLISLCPECDAGHCPHCLRHLGPDERYCTECGTDLSLRERYAQPAE